MVKKFSPDIEELGQIFFPPHIKRIIETFLDVECAPSISKTPRQARKMRRGIINILHSCQSLSPKDLPSELESKVKAIKSRTGRELIEKLADEIRSENRR